MIKSIELFSGTGGLALGLHQAGFVPTALLEWDKNSCENVKANIVKGYHAVSDWNIVQTDVRLVHYSDYGVDINFVSGGLPCQPFSLGGKHKANFDTRDMFLEAVRAVRELQPQGFIFENVKGLLRKSFASYFNYILLQLSHPDVVARKSMDWTEHLKMLEEYHTSNGNMGLGYNVVFRLVNAADYGVPQQCLRVLIVGFRSDIDAHWSFPDPTHTKEPLVYSKFGDGSLRYYSVRESARIQTFPDDFQFYGSWTESMRQIGNAVPVMLANVIGSSIAIEMERIGVGNAEKRYSSLKAV